MKRLVAAAILTVFIIAVYLWGNFYIKNLLKKSNELVDKCTQSYTEGGNAKKTAKDLKDYWDKNESMLSLFAHHQDIDEVEKAVNTIYIYSDTAEKEIFLEYSQTVKTLLHQLKEDASISVHSVF